MTYLLSFLLRLSKLSTMDINSGVIWLEYSIKNSCSYGKSIYLKKKKKKKIFFLLILILIIILLFLLILLLLLLIVLVNNLL